MSSHEHTNEDCADYLERIVYLLDNELDQADCVVVETHLRECGPCLERYDLQRTVKTLVARSCRENAPEGLRDRVRMQIREVQVRITETTEAMEAPREEQEEVLRILHAAIARYRAREPDCAEEEARRAFAAAAASCMTVRIVPSTGLWTAL